METTRRYWVTVALAGLVALWALLLERVVLVVGAAGIAGWLLVRQYRFVRTVSETSRTLDIDQRVDRSRVTAGEQTVATVAVETERPVVLTLDVVAAPPVGSDAEAVNCRLDPGEEQAERVFEVGWPVAGAFEFGQPTVTFTDPLGLVRQTTQLGPTPTVTVEPRAPSDIHIGEGGDRVTAGFGEHKTGLTGRGFTPAEVRKYLSGDSFRQIDWKATARLAEPHVREFESETDLETVLLLDHRATMGAGPDGERKLDFVRQVALAVLRDIRVDDDPLVCQFIGDEGLTRTFGLGTGADHYRAIDTAVRRVEPTLDPTATARSETPTPTDTRRTADRLDGDSQFDRRLRPFFDDTAAYVQRIAERPLFASIRTIDTQRRGTVRTIICTDDTHRTELKEAVRIARRGNGRVSVFLTPSILYGDPGLNDLEATYQQYTEFEAFRRELASIPGVDAYEVGPSDRLTSVLSVGQRRATR